jgi:hypothetical protein
MKNKFESDFCFIFFHKRLLEMCTGEPWNKLNADSSVGTVNKQIKFSSE